MTNKIFRNHIRAALANPTLQAALDGNAERRRGARQQAYASLPENLDVLRQRAHAMRAQTIANLENYLEQFSANAQANGFIIHRAANGEEAVQIVRQIAQEQSARLISKSKTMVGEEIHLNPALEADGLQVVETDLGEYIVQLRHEPPAHIITPAVHLTRTEVGHTFQETLGVPFSDDIPTLTAIARRVLRQTFLETDIGVSGVNFGIAENGALCLVTNEGNGRMVTTLPEVHIALMGIERLVPTLEDLALMLYLLPRSATGQKLSVYTSLIFGPRRAGEVDGPRQRHLILVDNGRRQLRASPLAEALYCIRCGACLNACPVFREIGGHAYVSTSGRGTPYPGPIGSVVSPGLFGAAEFGHLSRASSLCGACKEACPVQIDLPKLLLRVRATDDVSQSSRAPKPSSRAGRGLRWSLRLFTWIAVSPGRFAAAQRLAGLASRILAPGSAWLRLPAFTGWGYRRDFPRPAMRPFRHQFTPAPPPPNAHATAPANRPAATPDQPPVSPPSVTPVERFQSEIAELGATFSLCQASEAAGQILAALQAEGITAIQAWGAEHLPASLLDTLQDAGIQVSQEPDPNLRAGLTGALAGIAESGSIVIPGGAARPLTASLLPEIHFAILRLEDIYTSLPLVLPQIEALQRSGAVSSIALVSGPSRTADIEMTLTLGVHGPRRLHVFCITP